MSLIKIVIYATSAGKEPYSDWENELDKTTQAIIKNRLDRMRLGNFGDSKIIKGVQGIWELRINYGPGYRIYFGKQESIIVVLLLGGHKKSQRHDIAKAKQYWRDYKDQL